MEPNTTESKRTTIGLTISTRDRLMAHKGKNGASADDLINTLLDFFEKHHAPTIGEEAASVPLEDAESSPDEPGSSEEGHGGDGA